MIQKLIYAPVAQLEDGNGLRIHSVGVRISPGVQNIINPLIVLRIHISFDWPAY